MTHEEIIQKVNEILVQGFEVETSRLSPDARLNKDLDLDSLDAVDLVVALEKKFGCRIEEEEAREMQTLQDIYDFIQKRDSAGSAGG